MIIVASINLFHYYGSRGIIPLAGPGQRPGVLLLTLKKAEAGFASASSACAAGRLANFDTLLDETMVKAECRRLDSAGLSLSA
ncbi:MAG: hypothetical protein H7838_12550 [Magnetococcus sp. DMHC-8]